MFRIFLSKDNIPAKAKCIFSLAIDNFRSSRFFGLFFMGGKNG